MIDFKTMTDAQTDSEAAAEVIEMMKSLYDEDPFAPHARHDQFPRTLHHLLASPATGRVVLFLEQNAIRGYALLIPFWSNEFGGNVVVIDEIYVQPTSRNRGIARAFFAFVADKKPFNAVALGLEVSPDNHAARRLYTSLGFTPRTNLAMTYRLPES
jgi:GNAT superfamily N-acetyltransferase